MISPVDLFFLGVRVKFNGAKITVSWAAGAAESPFMTPERLLRAGISQWFTIPRIETITHGT
jgi:hypothetical protein